jgi:tetratricopeptide (TPR) repeat protein
MDSSKLATNLVLALIVIVLASTAATFIYKSADRPEVRTGAVADPSGGQLPENHPQIDAANRLAALEQMSAKDPQNADLQKQMGNLYYDIGRYDKAMEHYQKSLSIRPQDANVETDLATCWYNIGQHDKALETIDKVLTYSPRFSQAKYNKGIVLLSGKNDAKSAIAVWEDLLRTDPAYPMRTELEQRVAQLKASLK